ncbi:MAG: BamA/TamA family outer membrane protein [Saprospiraceae bacterium]
MYRFSHRFLLPLLYYFPLGWWLCIGMLNGQNPIAFQLQGIDQDSATLSELLTYESIMADSLTATLQLQQILQQLNGQSYIEASIDSLVRTDTSWTAFVYTGKTYEWAQLLNGNIEEAFLTQVGFRERLYQKKPFHYNELRLLMESLLEYAENNGYPFADVWLDDIEINQGSVRARLYMKKGPLILLDGINLITNPKSPDETPGISAGYMENYLGLKKGQLYSKAKVKKIRGRIKELPFVKERQDATVTFRGSTAIINLFLKKRKSSRFDIVFGLLPNNSVAAPGTPEPRRFLFTGTVDLDLHNQFGAGEKITIAVEQIRPQTQEMELHFLYPYVLNTPFGFDGNFLLYKIDTTNLDVTYDLGVQYQLEGGNYLKAFWNNASSSILTVNTARIQQQGKLPVNLDFTNASFGLEYNYRQLDYRFNPRKGWGLLLRGETGIKRIRKNNAITDIEDDNIDFSMAYDSLNLRTFQYRIHSRIEGYLPAFQRSTLKAAANIGIILSPQQDIYKNEQYRIGGNRLLRGFDERSVFATRYAIFTLEYRLLIGQNSYLYAFTDGGYYEDVTTSTRRFERPVGFGAGLTFETKVGLFGFSLALGKLQDNPIDFRTVKTHFGYVSLF